MYLDTLLYFIQHVLHSPVQGVELIVRQDRAEGVSTQDGLHHTAQHALLQQP